QSQLLSETPPLGVNLNPEMTQESSGLPRCPDFTVKTPVSELPSPDPISAKGTAGAYNTAQAPCIRDSFI
ncbi:MAG: hypothetical protein K2H95_08790, partial [Bacteroidales bacterium]|nr:hypothetical protein [Bacteroidales bacterium]